MRIAFVPVFEDEKGASEMVPLRGDMSDETIARFLITVCDYGRAVQVPTSPAAAVASLAREPRTRVVAGGLMVLADGAEIEPSCCCGLEDWQQWYWPLEDGPGVSLGHDPEIWVEDLVGGFRIHEGRDESFSVVETSKRNYQQALAEAESHLGDALVAIRRYCDRVAPVHTEKLVANLNDWFCFTRGRHS